MALEAGDMEDGQLSDSDSDMTVVPSDRPVQMAVSERARGRPGRTPGERGRQEGRGRPRDAASRRLWGPGGDSTPRSRRPRGLPNRRTSPRWRLLLLHTSPALHSRPWTQIPPKTERGDRELRLPRMLFLLLFLADRELLAYPGPGVCCLHHPPTPEFGQLPRTSVEAPGFVSAAQGCRRHLDMYPTADRALKLSSCPLYPTSARRSQCTTTLGSFLIFWDLLLLLKKPGFPHPILTTAAIRSVLTAVLVFRWDWHDALTAQGKVLGGDSVACAPVSHYRTVKNVDSSEESVDSDEDCSLWKRKRQKCLNPPPKPEPFPFGQSSQKTALNGGRKVNNIWGAVLQEQNQDAVAIELGILGMEGTLDRSRQSETYNYLLAKKLKRESQESTKELDKDLDEYMHGDKKPGSKEEENGQGHLKRKRPVKDRLGNRVEMNYKGRYEITEDDSQEKDIFYIENQKEYENKKAARKRRTQLLGKKMKQAIKSLNFQEDDDTSRETFASDTNEALASLDEAQEGPSETKLDAEEAIEVDHPQDLDIF
ncbi:phosphorylated adaptor for RNA export [Cricetulus griseus]